MVAFRRTGISSAPSTPPERRRAEARGTGFHPLDGPRLSILDEPDSGIDVLSLSHILDAVRTLAKNGASVLLITTRTKSPRRGPGFLLVRGTILRTGDPVAIGRFFRNHCRSAPMERASRSPAP